MLVCHNNLKRGQCVQMDFLEVQNANFTFKLQSKKNKQTNKLKYSMKHTFNNYLVTEQILRTKNCSLLEHHSLRNLLDSFEISI